MPGTKVRNVSMIRRTRTTVRVPKPGEKSCYFIQGSLRRGKTNALGRCLAQQLQPLERERQMRAALGAGDSVYFIDDHGPDAAEHATTPRRGEHDMKRFRRCDQDVWRLAEHPRTRRCRCVAGAHGDADVREIVPGRREAFA